MIGIGNSTRIAFGLALLTVCIVSGAYAIGLMPTQKQIEIDQRKRTSELLATQLSAAISTQDGEGAKRLAERIIAASPELSSIGLHRADGTLVLATDGHAATWAQLFARGTAGRTFEVPLFDGPAEWGTLQMVFEPRSSKALFGDYTVVVFVAGMSVVAFTFYMRRTLKVLDPSQVVPDRVRATLDTLSEGAVIADSSFNIVLANRAFADLVGIEQSKIVGQSLEKLPWVQSDHAGDSRPWAKALKNETQRGVPLRVRAGERFRALMANVTPVHGAGTSVRGVLMTLEDVSSIEEKNVQLVEMVRQLNVAQERVTLQNEELQRLATRDVLTGCLNRRAFHEQLSTLYGLARRHGTPLSAVMVDADHFKSVNDQYGHGRGDDVLREIGRRLNATVRQSDVVCRYGGEEFCVLLPLTPADAAAAVAETIRAALSASPIAELNITASLGVSSTESAVEGERQLVEQADLALYASKKRGRNRVTSFGTLDPATIAEKPQSATRNQAERIPIPAVMSLLSALSFRDPQTGDHSRRVADMCVRAARGLFSEAETFVLEVAALLHDIGKIGVPDTILLKPGKLSAAEWEIMSQHDRIGVEIVQSAFGCESLSEIIRRHHGRFDEAPTEAIDPAADSHQIALRQSRLLAIADAYDAMTNDRVYRAAMSQEQSFEELRKCAGSQFDPELVEHFIHTVSQRSAEQDKREMKVARRLRLALDSERIATALRRGDLQMVAALAGHLQATAMLLGDTRTAELAGQIRVADAESMDVKSLVQQVQSLLMATSPDDSRGTTPPTLARAA